MTERIAEYFRLEEALLAAERRGEVHQDTDASVCADCGRLFR